MWRRGRQIGLPDNLAARDLSEVVGRLLNGFATPL